MLLPLDEAEHFFRLYSTLLIAVDRELRLLPATPATPSAFGALPLDQQLLVRNALLEDPELLESFIATNPAGLDDDDLEIVRSWRHLTAGEFYIFRELKAYTVFLGGSARPVAYGVLGYGQSFAALFGLDLPLLVVAVLLPYRGRIIFDGLLVRIPNDIGLVMPHILASGFAAAKVSPGIITTLPAPAAKLPKKPRAAAKPTGDAAAVLATITGLTDQFCRARLNNEYAELCRKLAEQLARKRPSPLLRGKPQVWACAIVRVIGWVNFLDDPTQKPHLKLTAIDKAFGVGESTGQGKAKAIRDLLKIGMEDFRWMRREFIETNSLVWLISVNGLIQDARDLPRAIQEEAFRKGMIPYVPGVIVVPAKRPRK